MITKTKHDRIIVMSDQPKHLRASDMDVEALPCPFCGNPYPETQEYPSGWFMECVCDTDKGPYPTQRAAIIAWNQRDGSSVSRN